MLRYVGDRIVVIPCRSGWRTRWTRSPSRDVLYYLVAAADADQVPAGAYDISGPESTTYRKLLPHMAAQRAGGGLMSDSWRGYQRGVDGDRARIAGARWPRLDHVESLDHPMRASNGLRDVVSRSARRAGDDRRRDQAISAQRSIHARQ